MAKKKKKMRQEDKSRAGGEGGGKGTEERGNLDSNYHFPPLLQIDHSLCLSFYPFIYPCICVYIYMYILLFLSLLLWLERGIYCISIPLRNF